MVVGVFVAVVVCMVVVIGSKVFSAKQGAELFYDRDVALTFGQDAVLCRRPRNLCCASSDRPRIERGRELLVVVVGSV